MPTYSRRARDQAGLTLIELIIAIVVLGIAAVAVLQSLGVLVVRNVDPMLRSQSRLLAESMINEVQTQAFFDASVDPTLNPGIDLSTVNICPTPETLSSYNRNSWDNVCDYTGYDSDAVATGNSTGPRTRNGTPITQLAAYRVQVSVNTSVGLTLGTGLSNIAGCIPQLARITVTVTDPRGQPLTLDAYRASYFDDPRAGC
ncbi:hypothetical protein BGP77_10680 [Saccharospirillum sp. MSK14-1]|uniref:type IV pilus modification PilV family protein n=1 Tax=Saccharospirillum sp. MSK14-1 TaxID=1897632 RepID=UPI000D4662FC|nr:type II secretion system protein [Saccharospirillum sp. MSK14-1]PTY38640.1 hypothetical protein BGP77_10680 [Saccharospirillum sp. MSK14-1]